MLRTTYQENGRNTKMIWSWNLNCQKSLSMWGFLRVGIGSQGCMLRSTWGPFVLLGTVWCCLSKLKSNLGSFWCRLSKIKYGLCWITFIKIQSNKMLCPLLKSNQIKSNLGSATWMSLMKIFEGPLARLCTSTYGSVLTSQIYFSVQRENEWWVRIWRRPAESKDKQCESKTAPPSVNIATDTRYPHSI